MTKYLHTMIRVSSLEDTIAFFAVLGDTCNAFIAHGVTINRPPRDGRMAFIRTPDGISIELLQAGDALPPAEPWSSMPNTGSW